jgi:hypothetical protein
MLFFIDESWQTIGGREIGALGGVVIPERRYNDFCREVFAFKRDVLKAKELSDCEIKGNKCFARKAFKRRDRDGFSNVLDAAEKMFDALKRHKSRVFLIWTENPDLLLLRHPKTTELSKPYKQLLFDLRGYMRNEASTARGSLNFDQRHVREDEAAACAISNYLIRSQSRFRSHFIQIPNFTVSSISPGLQAADLMVYLGPHLADGEERPELAPYIERMRQLRYEFRAGKRKVKTIRRVG